MHVHTCNSSFLYAFSSTLTSTCTDTAHIKREWPAHCIDTKTHMKLDSFIWGYFLNFQLPGNTLKDVPVAVIASDRPHYLYRWLWLSYIDIWSFTFLILVVAFFFLFVSLTQDSIIVSLSITRKLLGNSVLKILFFPPECCEHYCQHLAQILRWWLSSLMVTLRCEALVTCTLLLHSTL